MSVNDWLFVGILAMFVIAGIFKAMMDTLQFHFHQSIFSTSRFDQRYVNPNLSWVNKYKNRDPRQGERFLGSTTFFVFITDAWHLSQFLFLNSLFIALIFAANMDLSYRPAIYSIGIGLGWAFLFRGVFRVLYGKILIQRRWRD